VSSAREKFAAGRTPGKDDPALALRWHGDRDELPARAWLVEGLLPETGSGLASGQWGTYKTFAALDLAAAVMAGGRFVDRTVARRGGVLFIAVEGAAEIEVRLQAVLETKYPEIERAPFAWSDHCPPLLEKDSAAELAAVAQQAAERMQAEFKLPLALIIIAQHRPPRQYPHRRAGTPRGEVRHGWRGRYCRPRNLSKMRQQPAAAARSRRPPETFQGCHAEPWRALARAWVR
jgi:hypothetical protein